MAVTLNLVGDYTPPSGSSVTLNLGGDGGETTFLASITAQLPPPTVAITASRVCGVIIAAQLPPPTVAITAYRILRAAIAARGTNTVAITADYDPNLLSEIHRHSASRWQAEPAHGQGATARWQSAVFIPTAKTATWQDSQGEFAGSSGRWQVATLQTQATQPRWQESPSLAATVTPLWQVADAVRSSSHAAWNPADGVRQAESALWRVAPRLTPLVRDPWQVAAPAIHSQRHLIRDALPLRVLLRSPWNRAGYPDENRNLPKDAAPAWERVLVRLWQPLPSRLILNLGAAIVPEARWSIAERRTYMSINSASLVRWPDLTPLPCTRMTLETDADSWCWALSATLAGPDAWALVQPNPLACEVQATINGQSWAFLLDVPNQQRAFNSDQVTIRGRSRSAWLQDPYSAPVSYRNTSAREMQQLGEEALDNSGWTLDWQGENWLVPMDRWQGSNTPMGQLIRLAQATDDLLYTHPTDQVITLQKRWPTPSWLLDDALIEVLIPESAILQLSRSPVYTPPINGVYVSGTSHGVLGFVRIAGTDGTLQPTDPVVHELLCDEEGVAARQRGLNALSDSGTGFAIDAETLFNNETGLVPPGLIVSIAGMRISAQWSSGLQVIQSIGLERREVES